MTAEQVEQLAVALLAEQWPWQWDGYRYTEVDLYRVLLAAAVQQASVTSICGQVSESPSANWVRHVLQTQLLDGVDAETLEAELNNLLWQRLPPGLLDRPRRVVVDLTLRPYYGRVEPEPHQLRRGEAKAGTTRFHGYATAYVLEDGARVTVAVSFVWAEETLVDVLTDLLERVQQRGARVSRLDLDRGFASVAILRYLDQQPFLSIVALPKRGQRLKALLTGTEPIQTTSTMTSAEDGALTFPLWIACCPPEGDRMTPAYLAFAVLRPQPADLDVAGVAEPYRERCGVEARYRQLNEVRVRTTLARSLLSPAARRSGVPADLSLGLSQGGSRGCRPGRTRDDGAAVARGSFPPRRPPRVPVRRHCRPLSPDQFACVPVSVSRNAKIVKY